MPFLVEALVAASGRGVPPVSRLIDEALVRDAVIDVASAEAELAQMTQRIADAEGNTPDPAPDAPEVDPVSLAKAASVKRRDLNTLRRRRGILARNIEEAHERNRRAAERDRPEGCWCLGLGGREPVGVGRLIDVDSGNEWAGTIREVDHLDVLRFAQYCACSDGVRIAAEHEAAIRESLERNARDRSDRRLQAHWADIGMPNNSERYPTLESFPTSDPRQIEAVSKLQAWRPPRWLYLYGPTRRGKTTLAAALARHADEQGYSVRFRTMDQILERLKAAMDHEGEAVDDVLQPLLETQFLVIDDLGAEIPTRWAVGRILRMLDERLTEGLTTVITSNLDLGKSVETSLASHIISAGRDDPDYKVQAGRIITRIREAADIVLVDGPVLMPDQADPLPW